MQTAFELETAQFIVDALNLDIEAQSISPETPLFADGLGLDSIDVLELALAISKQYGFQLKSDAPENKEIFSSLRSLSAHIASHRV